MTAFLSIRYPFVEGRWGFLRPWCSKLSGLGLLLHKGTVVKGLLWHPKQRVLQVLVSDSPDGFFEHPEDFCDGDNGIQLIREALALQAAVEHVDYDTWRYLLENHCGVPSRFSRENVVVVKLCLSFPDRQVIQIRTNCLEEAWEPTCVRDLVVIEINRK